MKLDADGVIRRGTIKEFLLEKPRVVSQANGERNYHIFYQLLSDDKTASRLRKVWGLNSNIPSFSYLNQSGCTSVAGINDAADFMALCRALALFGIEAAMQEDLLQLTAAILVLGNITMNPNPKDKDTSEIDSTSQPFLMLAAKLFGLTEEELATCFLQQKMKIGNISKNRTVYQAKDIRDSVAKCLFGYAFEWLIVQMNKNFEVADAAGLITFGVLDVFGFEDFDNNSLEQLCINFANEKLQQQFNTCVFETELKDYREQGMNVESLNITPPCNQAVLNLIEHSQGGIFATLDEECKIPNGSDESFLDKCNERFLKLYKKEYTKVKTKGPKDTPTFAIAHYAGQVIYNTSGWLNKNRDPPPTDFLEVILERSTFGFAKMLIEFAEVRRAEAVVARSSTATSRTGSGARTLTVTGKFKSSLAALRMQIEEGKLHYIRCLKPNSLNKSDTFDSHFVLNQLRCSQATAPALSSVFSLPALLPQPSRATAHCT